MLTNALLRFSFAQSLEKTRLTSRAPALVTSLLVLLAFCCVPVSAQNVQHSTNSRDLGLRHDFSVDPVSLSLNLQITLGGYNQRGGSSLPVAMRYSSKLWRLDYVDFKPPCLPDPIGCDEITYTMLSAIYGDPINTLMTEGWSSTLQPPYLMADPEVFDSSGRPCDPNNCGVNNTDRWYMRRIRLRMPDGSIHELMADDNIYYYTQPPSYPLTYAAVDGSAIRYIDQGNGQATTLLTDGSRYITTNYGAAAQFIDRNGNTLTYSQANNTWTDSIGRAINLQSMPGFNNTTLNFGVTYRVLKVEGHPEQSALTNYYQTLRYRGPGGWWGAQTTSPVLFDSSATNDKIGSDGPFNPSVIYEISGPDGRKYTFTYNIYGEIDKVVYPTGGYERFEYAAVPAITIMNAPYNMTNRGVIRRWVSPDGTAGSEQEWQYGAEEVSATVLKTFVVAPNGTVTERFVHRSRLPENKPFGFDDAKAGMVYAQCVYAPGAVHGQKGAMLRRTLTEWTLTQYVKQGGNIPGGFIVTRDPRVTKQVDILLDTGGDALRTTTTYQHDADLNVISTSKYDFVAVNQTTAQTGDISSVSPPGSPGTLLRTDETTFFVNDATIDSGLRATYRARNLVKLPSSTRVQNAAGMVAQSEIKYDETAFPILTYGAVSGWTDPNTTVRGLATTIRSWLNPSGIWIQSHVQYDQFGNPRKSWDAKDTSLSNPTQTEYSSTYSYAYPTTVTSADPDAGGSAVALVTTTAYDFTSGMVTATTDPNNKTTTMEYASVDALGNSNSLQRLTKTNRPDGGWTAYAYGDTPGNLFVLARTALDASRYTQVTQYFDGLGRGWRSVQSEGATSIYVDTQYDSMGRAWKGSNPYRGGETPLWTTTGFDPLSRVTSVTTTADSAVVTTSYLANTVTVIDQAGKKRRSVSDALGRLVRVDEPDANNNLDSNGVPIQPTAYFYDVLGNLARVTQGSQQRFFMYDSLSRLIRAINPEQDAHSSLNLTDPLTGNGVWTVAYQYDNNGNLTQKTDARTVSSTYAYDALNRNTTIDYSDTAAINPDITRFYDGATNGKGRFWYNYAGGSYSVGTTVEHTAVDSYDAVGRPQIQRQVFKQNSVWGPTYQISRSYNLGGGVTTQTYPSVRTVNYTYDDAGRINSFTGNLGDGTNRTYATGINYSVWGGLSREQFGTDIPLYHRQLYTNRGQLFDMRVATTDDGSWNRGAIVNYYSLANFGFGNTGTDTNGNLYVQQHYIPHNDQMSAYTVHQQNYAYDSLNRITWVGEYLNAATNTGSQHYLYDRWGNRSINPATWGTGINNKQFAVNTANNRLGVPGGQSGVMSYDSAGNLTTDTYSGAGSRSYDAENKMITAQGGAQSGLQYYTYNVDGQRVRRKVDGVETWQVYGMDGELLAEYAASAAATSPQKEYGYRNGQLLITAANSQGCGLGHTGSKTWTATSPSLGHATGQQEGSNWAVYVGSHSPTAMVFGPYDSSFGQGHHTAEFWLMVDNNSGTDVVATIDVVTGYGGTILAQRQIRRNEFTVANQWQIFTLEFNNPCFGLVESRVWWAGTVNMKFSQVTLSASNASAVDIKWLVADHLGTPRMIFDKTGSLANVKRHDYLPFGEELFAGVGGRTTANGYSGDGVREKFTEKERDNETGLDYFLARYYSSTQGRFTSPDEFTGGPDELFRFAQSASENPTFYADLASPQSLNKYQYCFNNPLSYVDPDGHVGIYKRKGLGKTISERLKAGARAVGKTLVRTANGAASTISENNGFGRMNAEQNSVGRGLGHVLTGVQVGAEIAGGVTVMTGGGGGAVLTAPACGTGVGCAVPAVGVGTAIVGAVVTGHGILVGVNTLTNIFSSSKNDHPDTDKTTVEGTQDQLDDITANQAEKRKLDRPDAIQSTEKSKQRADTALKKIKRLEDVEDQ